MNEQQQFFTIQKISDAIRRVERRISQMDDPVSVHVWCVMVLNELDQIVSGSEPQRAPVISRSLNFPDGSRLRVIVEAPAGGERRDAATASYYHLIRPELERIETSLLGPLAAGTD